MPELPADVTTVIIGGCDLNGQFRAKRIPAWRASPGALPRIAFSSGMFAMDLDDELQPRPAGFRHWFPSWADGYPDIFGHADLTTLRTVPWLDRTALALCDFEFADGRPVRVAPRHVLRRAVALYDGLGIVPRVAPEYEFMLLKETEESLHAKDYLRPRPYAPAAQVYSGLRAAWDAPVIDSMRGKLEEFQIPVAAWNSEGAAGQYELNLPPAPPLQAADRGFLFKQAVKEIAGLGGLIATFMPKPAAAGLGNGLHLHQSLWTAGGEPASADPGSRDGLSTVFRHYLAGQLATLREFTALFLPTVNDYKRSIPHSGAAPRSPPAMTADRSASGCSPAVTPD